MVVSCDFLRPLVNSSLRGAQRRSNPFFLSAVTMDCFASLAMTTRKSPRANQRDRLVALEQIKQTAQRFAAVALEFRIVLHDAQGFVAGLGDELAVYLGARDAVTGQAALPVAEHVAFAAQLQIFLGNP